jgi:hypothetical protein
MFSPGKISKQVDPAGADLNYIIVAPLSIIQCNDSVFQVHQIIFFANNLTGYKKSKYDC